MWGLCNFDSFTGIYFDGNKSENEKYNQHRIDISVQALRQG